MEKTHYPARPARATPDCLVQFVGPLLWLMEEILHQLIWRISHYLQFFFKFQVVVWDFWTITKNANPWNLGHFRFLTLRPGCWKVGCFVKRPVLLDFVVNPVNPVHPVALRRWRILGVDLLLLGETQPVVWWVFFRAFSREEKNPSNLERGFIRLYKSVKLSLESITLVFVEYGFHDVSIVNWFRISFIDSICAFGTGRWELFRWGLTEETAPFHHETGSHWH